MSQFEICHITAEAQRPVKYFLSSASPRLCACLPVGRIQIAPLSEKDTKYENKIQRRVVLGIFQFS